MKLMPQRCVGCAYTAGTEANRDPLTTLTRELCEAGDVNFYCHANMVDDKLPANDKRLCRGFHEATLTRAITTPANPLARAVAREGLRQMEEAEQRAKHGLPELSRDELMQQLLARVSRRIGRQSGHQEIRREA